MFFFDFRRSDFRRSDPFPYYQPFKPNWTFNAVLFLKLTVCLSRHLPMYIDQKRFLLVKHLCEIDRQLFQTDWSETCYGYFLLVVLDISAIRTWSRSEPTSLRSEFACCTNFRPRSTKSGEKPSRTSTTEMHLQEPSVVRLLFSISFLCLMIITKCGIILIDDYNGMDNSFYIRTTSRNISKQLL